MKKTIAILALALIVSAVMLHDTAAAADGRGEPIRLMRRPDIHGNTIVFAWQGDLWSVPAEGGLARRLTVHVGIEDHPKFSPDGTMIAITGDYNERRNALFVMPAEGGRPKQLTWHTDSAEPVEWAPDGKSIVFRSRRDSFVGFFKQFYTVPVDGGLPVDMGVGKASLASFSPDGKQIAFNRHPERFWWWKRYKGSQNQDVWIYDLEKESYDKLTEYEGNDSWPMWVGDRIYFVSDRDTNVKNIYYIDLGTKDITKVTDFKGRGVTWPSLNEDGSKIVFENDAKLFVLDTTSGKTREVVVYAPADDRTNMLSHINPLKYIRSFDISATGKRIVFEARGEIYTAPAEHGDVRNLTNSSGSRDSYPTWSPDGKWIAYISDKSGDDEVYLIDQMGKKPEKKLTDSGHFKENIMWSPESDRMLFSTEANELYMLGIDGKKLTLINRNEHRDITTYAWSPDGRYVAYDFAVRNRARDIYLYDTKEKKHHQITSHMADDTEPVFTPDGKYLLLISERYHGARMLCRLSLLPEDEEPFIFEDDEENVDGADDDEDKVKGEDDDDDKDDDGDKKDKKGKKKKDEKVVVKIDFDGIEGRIRRVPKAAGRMMNNVNATDKYYYYLVVGQVRMMFRRSYDLYAYDIEKMKADKVASTIVAYGMSADKKKIAVFDGSNFEIFKVGGKKSSGKKPTTAAAALAKTGKLDIKRKVIMDLDREAEWSQIFNEGWRLVKYHFYDPNYHGVDWDEVHDYYEALLPSVRTRTELNWLMTEMVGELNASHQGVSGGDASGAPRTALAFLGAKLELDEKSGYARFTKIFKGDKLSTRERSPLDADYVKVKEGDYLLAINGIELEPGENFFQYLIARTRNKVTITTNDKPTMKGAIETKFTPISHDLVLRYKNWVDGNVEQVDKASENRIGYMHLKDMSGTGWTEFREKFEQFRYKDAIIIDVRYNGGGSIDTRVIDYLERRPYHVQRSRGESVITRPYDVFTGEVVVLHNEYSYSDAEVFPSAVKERGLGTCIGVPTLGFVIAVTPHYLVDGGAIRKTFIGIWEEDNLSQLESRGAIPDIYVESPPAMEKAGRDMQLEKAIEFLLGKIGDESREHDVKLKIEER